MGDETISRGGNVSDPGTKMEPVTDEANLDELVQRASVPNLASLFKKGKERGLIKAQQEYAHSSS